VIVAEVFPLSGKSGNVMEFCFDWNVSEFCCLTGNVCGQMPFAFVTDNKHNERIKKLQLSHTEIQQL